ncbi:transketolase C-terminal domain-containing protein [Sulfurimonas sp. HSL-1716]|uniref:transketolase family protein n=1 Tax=Hydrocurvibacter sulfurireducens TaxID=3131937 RepID=UPI0031F7F980
MRNTAAKKIFEYCKSNSDGFLISGDAGFGVWEEFQQELEKQYINTGINEAAMTGLAAGMALSGHKVFIYNIIPFLIMRNYEQVRVDIAYQNLPVIMIGIGSGITYAPAGMTHYALEDIALAKTMPNLNIISPSDPVQVEKALEYAISSANPTFIRLSKSGEAVLFDQEIDISKPIIMKKREKKALLFHGSIVDEVMKASLELKDVAIISMPMISPIDENEVIKILQNYNEIYIVEEHFKEGGLGSILCDLAQTKRILVDIIKIAVPNHYIHEIGNCAYLRQKLQIDADSIIKIIKSEK